MTPQLLGNFKTSCLCFKRKAPKTVYVLHAENVKKAKSDASIREEIIKKQRSNERKAEKQKEHERSKANKRKRAD